MKHTPEEVRELAAQHRGRVAAEDDLRAERIPPFDRISTLEAIERHETLKIARMLEEYADHLDRERWIPVSERLPDDRGLVLLYFLNDITGEKHVTVAFYDDEINSWHIYPDLASEYEDLAWRELSQPPEEP